MIIYMILHYMIFMIFIIWFTWYSTVNYSTLFLLNLFLMQNLIYKTNPLLANFGMVKSLDFAAFLLESVSSSNFSSLIKLYCKIFGKLKIFCLRLYLESLFPSWHLQQKVLKLVSLFRRSNYWLEVVVESKLISDVS